MGKRMEAAQKAYDKAKVYTLEEGAQIVKDNAKAKFDESVLSQGSAVYAYTAMRWLQEHK